MYKFYWPALEPNLQGNLDTVVLQRDEVARRVGCVRQRYYGATGDESRPCASG